MNFLTKTATFCMLSFAASPAAALPAETCAVLSEGAGHIMDARQQGIPVGALLAVVEPTGDDQSVSDLYTAMIDDAYSWPQFYGEAARAQASQEFAAEIYTVCRSEGV